MKILVISLLRLGDILLHAELVRSLKAQYPKAEIHFLINKQFQSVQSILPAVSQWHLLDRQFLQQVLVEQHQSPLAAFDNLKNTIDSLNAEKFDLLLNATHNLFSVRLTDLIEAKEKRGAVFHNGKKVAFSSSWLNYFNDHYSELNGSRFHYVELLHRALGIEMLNPQNAEIRTEGPIYLQVLTADVKKNWGLDNFKQVKKSLAEKFSNEIKVICSPDEKDQVLQAFSNDEIITPSLEEARELFKSARLLVTGDTSIQHLAASVACPTFSVFIGSADVRKTSPWVLGSAMIAAKANCYPCRASQPCSQKVHVCAQEISAEVVSEQVIAYLKDSYFDLTKESSLFEQAVWRFHLDGETVQNLLILPHLPIQSAEQKQRTLKLHEDLLWLDQKIELISQSIFGSMSEEVIHRVSMEIRSKVESLRIEHQDVADSFLKMSQSFQVIDRSFFEFLKVLRSGWKEAHNLNQIRQRLIFIQNERNQGSQTEVSLE